jgi:hypothetical protein
MATAPKGAGASIVAISVVQLKSAVRLLTGLSSSSSLLVIGQRLASEMPTPSSARNSEWTML